MRHRARRRLSTLLWLPRRGGWRRRSAPAPSRAGLRLAAGLASLLLLISGAVFSAAQLQDETVPSSDGTAPDETLSRADAPSRSGAREPLATLTETPTLRAERNGPGGRSDGGAEVRPAVPDVRTPAADPRAEEARPDPSSSLTERTLSAAPSLGPTPRLESSGSAPDATASAPADSAPARTDASQSPSAGEGEAPRDDTAPETTLDSGPSSEESEEDSSADEATDGVWRRVPSLPHTEEPGESESSGGSDEAEFTFHANEDASFTCSLDGGAFRACDSPVEYDGLEEGWHYFEVRAEDRAGNADPSPARWRWYADGHED